MSGPLSKWTKLDRGYYLSQTETKSGLWSVLVAMAWAGLLVGQWPHAVCGTDAKRPVGAALSGHSTVGSRRAENGQSARDTVGTGSKLSCWHLVGPHIPPSEYCPTATESRACGVYPAWGATSSSDTVPMHHTSCSRQPLLLQRLFFRSGVWAVRTQAQGSVKNHSAAHEP